MTSTIKDIFEDSAELFARDHDAARFIVSVGNDLVGPMEVAVRMGDKAAKVDEPQAFGGGDTGPNPVQVALASLGSCQAITYRFWSEKLGIHIDHLRVEVQGDIDLRGLFGVHGAVRPGFGEVEVTVQITGPEPAERYEALRHAVDEHCPVLDVFANPVSVRTSLVID